MIQPGLVNALYAWAKGNDERITQLTTERDAIVDRLLNGGKDRQNMTTASANGKSFAFTNSLSIEDKLALLTAVLMRLGVIDPPDPSVTYMNLQSLRR